MKLATSVLACCLMFGTFSVSSFAGVKIENVKVVVTEKGKDPVTITLPYWVAKNTAQIPELLDLGNEHIPVDKVLGAIEKAPRLGPVMTVEKKGRKIVISIE